MNISPITGKVQKLYPRGFTVIATDDLTLAQYARAKEILNFSNSVIGVYGEVLDRKLSAALVGPDGLVGGIQTA